MLRSGFCRSTLYASRFTAEGLFHGLEKIPVKVFPSQEIRLVRLFRYEQCQTFIGAENNAHFKKETAVRTEFGSAHDRGALDVNDATGLTWSFKQPYWVFRSIYDHR